MGMVIRRRTGLATSDRRRRSLARRLHGSKGLFPRRVLTAADDPPILHRAGDVVAALDLHAARAATSGVVDYGRNAIPALEDDVLDLGSKIGERIDPVHVVPPERGMASHHPHVICP